MTCWRRLYEWTEAGVWPRIHQKLLGALGRRGRIDASLAVMDSAGVPLVVLTTAASVHDSQPAIALLDRMPKIPGRRGRPREKPDAALGDRAYGTPKNIAARRARGILPLPARIGTDHGSGRGTLSWVVESRLAWFSHYRRLKPCHERTGQHFQAFHGLAAALICARKLKRR